MAKIIVDSYHIQHYNHKRDDFQRINTPALRIESDQLPRISEVIDMLTKAKDMFGDIGMMIDDWQGGIKAGFSTVYYRPAEILTDQNNQHFTDEATCNILF